ncbi:MAG: glycoside hydrolase family 65 [Deltaproteobacteria bacterium]|nr:MAG: glycoside hydrolase family 65 [Deltaproteobacteria bacterium]
MLWIVFVVTATCRADGRIDRFALVSRHDPVVHKADALTPLSVGNGNFCFTADITGLQTFTDFYDEGIPLCIQSHWGWHRFPNPQGYNLEDTMVELDSHGRMVKYASQDSTKRQASEWLRANPHRLGLGRIGLKLIKSDDSKVNVRDCSNIEQKLDLWTGSLASRFSFDGKTVEVETCCHPELDMIAVRIKSVLISEDHLGVTIAFPYGCGRFGKEPGDWFKPQLHSTQITRMTKGRVELERKLDNYIYYVCMEFPKTANFNKTGTHSYELIPESDSDDFEFAAAFSPAPLAKRLPAVGESEAACKRHWKNFWESGAAVDLSGSTDERAGELERRVVLSQYLTAIQCAGTMPPAETGLTFNSWYGKAHLEMHWWHGVHFALWGRLPLFEKWLPWYQLILPKAKKTAKLQGYSGAHWPKMVGPDGREGPSSIGAFIIWQQPHPIYYAELCYRQHTNRKYLEKYKEIVFETAEFMSSFAFWDKKKARYVLGPPVMPVQERYDVAKTYNPTFELEYWRWGLETAQKWRQRLGLERNKKWDHVLKHLSEPPVKDGLYLSTESTPDTWITNHWKDHPSMLFAYGVLPPQTVDLQIMRRTLDKVMEKWDWPTTWGWDFPAAAITAARIGKPETAIDILLMKTIKNIYLLNGHNYQNGTLPIYLPGNGGLLTAVAMMAAGWDGAPKRNAPGFPDNGKWTVRWEGLKRMP